MGKKKGSLLTIYGPMFSGKTTYLIESYARDKKALSFKPSVDVRYTSRTVLRTHDGVETPAIIVPVEDVEEILDRVRELAKTAPIKTVIIDEVNFFSKKLVGVVKKLKSAGFNVVVAGLLLDSEKGDFGPTRALVAIADKTKPMYSRCEKRGCKTPAEFSYAKKPKVTQVVVGADDLYGAACSKHYDELHIPGKSETVLTVRTDVVRQLVDFGVYPAYADWLRAIQFPYSKTITTNFNAG